MMDIVRVLSLVLGLGCGCFLAEICPPDWHRYGESCFFIITDKMDWYQANRTCAESPANLVVPNSQFEQDYIWELFLKECDPGQNDRLWIGCNDIEEEGNWQYCPLKGKTNAYENWAEGEPNNGDKGEDCGVQYKKRNGQWNDVECDNQGFAICELPVSDIRVFYLQTGNDGRLIAQYMLHHVMEELPGKSLVSCGKACRSHPQCRSFNLLEKDEGNMVCQLNNATRREVADGDMKDSERGYFFDL